jgi:hypothetical protein
MDIFILIGVGALILSIIISLAIFNQITSREKKNQAESKAQEISSNAKPSWDLARVTLEEYFNRNLAQITLIFWLSLVVMVIGFGIIIWGITQSSKSPNYFLPGIIAGVTGVLTEFIGATFIFIYRSTIQQAMEYLKTLERMNSVGMAIQILDTIPDNAQTSDLKSKTKAMLVEAFFKQSYTDNKAENG